MDWSAFYNQVYTILVEDAGAHESYRKDFVGHALDEKHELIEWRFCGTLGFGGKVWRYDGRMYISCYPEDRTSAREATVEKVNARLKSILPPEGIHGPPEKHAQHVARVKQYLEEEQQRCK